MTLTGSPHTMTTVEERIIRDVITTCQAITSGAGWGTDVKLVQRQQGDVFQLTQYPSCIVIHDGCTEQDRRVGIIDAELHLSVQFAHKRAGADWPEDMSQFSGDLRKKIREDTQRGTDSGNANARHTHIEACNIGDGVIGGTSVTAGELRLRIPFAYLITDPTSAH